VGTVRRELLDHVVVLSEDHLRRLLREYVGYYNTERVHTSIGDTPEGRAVQERPSGRAKVIGLPRVGGLHTDTRGPRLRDDRKPMHDQTKTSAQMNNGYRQRQDRQKSHYACSLPSDQVSSLDQDSDCRGLYVGPAATINRYAVYSASRLVFQGFPIQPTHVHTPEA
jgi:Integrase core domain